MEAEGYGKYVAANDVCTLKEQLLRRLPESGNGGALISAKVALRTVRSCGISGIHETSPSPKLVIQVNDLNL
jgi:hypothetical protein